MKTLTVLGRRWFQETTGNTYHSCQVIVDGETIGKVTYAYGYGSHYLQTATNILMCKGLVPDIEHNKCGGPEPLWRYCEKHSIAFCDNCADVARKKDL